MNKMEYINIIRGNNKTAGINIASETILFLS